MCFFFNLCPSQPPEPTHPGHLWLTLPHPKCSISMTAVLFAGSPVALMQLLSIPNHFGVGLFVAVQFAGCQQAPAGSPYRVRYTPASWWHYKQGRGVVTLKNLLPRGADFTCRTWSFSPRRVSSHEGLRRLNTVHAPFCGVLMTCDPGVAALCSSVSSLL